jgi:prepilin-type N-terminal cleavage/methylation domain-containing protein
MNRSLRQDGFTLIELLLTVTIIGIVAATAMPGLGKAKAASSEAATIGALRAINGAQASYATSCSGGYFSPSITSLLTPPNGKAAFLGAEFAAGNTVTRQGYTIRFTSGPVVARAPKTCNGLAAGQTTSTYFVAADPAQVGASYGTRHFGTIASATLFESTANIAVFYSGTPPAPATPLK